ncbi:ATP-binding protein [Alicyclobacillus curvatus]|nr:ATP-binding protein [Alicyclobacillus curvatus]QSO52333.1 ATP-binding protein [Alicyclobacillus curvatus]QSO54760.1 ATP-binding protein [Alicyclobacillus curvatus]
MLNNQTIQILREMRLPGMADAYAHQLQTPNLSELTFEERFGMLVDAEYTARQNHRLTRLLREAHLKVQAHPEDIDYHQARGVDQGLLRSLFTGQWIASHHNLILTGPTGPVSWYSSSLFGHSKGLIPSELQLNFTVFV